jgi:hypothetical protein
MTLEIEEILIISQKGIYLVAQLCKIHRFAILLWVQLGIVFQLATFTTWKENTLVLQNMGYGYPN